MSSLRIALGLLAGLIGGLLLHRFPGTVSDLLWAILEPVGTLWLNALRMTVLPLVVALLVAGIGRSTETAGASRLALRSLRVFVVLLAVGAVLGAALSVGFLALWPVSPEAAARSAAAAPRQCRSCRRCATGSSR